MDASCHTPSATSCAKQLFLVCRGTNLQQIALVAALVQADATLRKLDKVIFRLIQLEHFHVGSLIDGARIEQKLVGRDAE